MPFVWFSIIASGVSIVGLSYLLNHYVNDKYGMDSNLFRKEFEKEDPNYTAIALKSSVPLLWLFALIYFVCVCCHIRNIKVSVRILSTSSVIMFKNLYVIFIPLLSLIFVLTWLSFWLGGFMFLLSAGEIT